MDSFELSQYVLTPTGNGLIDIQFSKRFIKQMRAIVRYTAGDVQKQLSLIDAARFYPEGDKQTLAFTARDQLLSACLRISGHPSDASLTFVVELQLVDPARPVRIGEIILASAELGKSFLGNTARDLLFRGEAPDAWTNAGNKRIDAPAEALEYASDTSYICGGYFHKQTGDGIFAYHIMPHQWIDYVKNDGGTLIAGQIVDVPVKGREVLRSDLMLLNFSEPLNTALASMAGHQKSRRSAVESTSHFGWNNFDYYKEIFDRQTIRDNMTAIKALPWMAEKMRYIIIDGMWESLVGDWETNMQRFPEGMEGMAREIVAEGFIPGIWISPLLADRNCKFLKDHPEYCVQYEGEPYSWYKLIGCDPPWGDRVYLDPTHPAVHEYVYKHLRQLYAWGYRYFKTDFLVDCFRPMLSVAERGYDKIDGKKLKFHNPDLGVAHTLHRKVMDVIRAAIGEESFWLGCGSFIPSGAELMDGSRPDIGIHWGQVRRNAQSAIFSAHLHGNAYLIDPDFAVFGGTMDPAQLDEPMEGRKKYSEEVSDSGPPMSGSQAEIWAATTILCGGLVCFGDKISAMNERGLSIMRTVLEYGGGQAATAIDFAEQIPNLWLKRDKGRVMLGVFNWDRAQERKFSLGASAELTLPRGKTVTELWSGKSGEISGVLQVTVPPMSVKLYVWEE